MLKTFKNTAFTMAEILLSLTIIGVVAAITLPSLTGNINERTWNTQRKALHARLSQAVSLMPSINGYGSGTSGTSSNPNWYGGAFTSDNATETFLTAGLSKVLKMNNICNHENLADCGFPQRFTTFGGTSQMSLDQLREISGLNEKYSGNVATGLGALGAAIYTKGAVFETANGESILTHYVPICKDNSDVRSGAGNMYSFEPIAYVCANFIYDLNGAKGPNTIGKDMGFMTLVYPFDSELVAPTLISAKTTQKVNHQEATRICRQYDDSRLPTMTELMSFTINKNIIGIENNGWDSYIWSATTVPSNNSQAYALEAFRDTVTRYTKTSSAGLQCVRRN